MAQQHVAIIGAGAAGLAMCRYLLKKPQIEFVAFEKACSIGGVWCYTKDSREVINDHNASPMYKNLRTNLPKEVMAYPDLPFPETLPSFITRADVRMYLEMYTEHFNLRKYIKFDHQVLSIKPVLGSNENQTWDVVVKDLKNETVHKIVFDAVVVCNGHFSAPRYPDVPGLDTFPGTILHSTDYNQPEDFQDQDVLVLGAGSSGLDITMDLAKFSKKIYLVHYGNKIPTEFPGNVQEIIGTLTACSNDIIEINHKELLKNVNAVILCTGYHYSFPFLGPECEIKVTNNRVTSLYKHIFSTKFPSLSFIGLCQRICPFLNFSAQAQLVASVLAGKTMLPSHEEMIKDEELDHQERLKQGVPANMMHFLGPDRQFEYCAMLAKMAGIPSVLTPTVQSLHCYASNIRKTNLATYRDMNFTIQGDKWQEIKSNVT